MMQNTIYETYIRLTDTDMEYDEYLMHCSTIAEPKPVNNKKSLSNPFKSKINSFRIKSDIFKHKSCIL